MFAQAGTRRVGGDVEQLAAVVTFVVMLISDLALLSSAKPEPADSKISQSITDGQQIAPHEFPFLVGIWEADKDGLEHRCTGSIVGPKHIVTSAKCVDRTANELIAKFGCTHPTQCKQEIDIARILLHPYFYLSKIRERDQYDLALLLTREPIDVMPESGIMPVSTRPDRLDPRCKRRYALAGFAKRAGPIKTAMLKYRATTAYPAVCAGITNAGEHTICVHSTGGFLPKQFIGSAFISYPINNKDSCAGQEIQLIGLVSAVGRNIASIVTNLNETQAELWRLGGLP